LILTEYFDLKKCLLQINNEKMLLGWGNIRILSPFYDLRQNIFTIRQKVLFLT